MTATDRGLKNDSMEAASARCSRLLITPIAVSVASIGNSRLTTPSSNPLTSAVAGVAEGLDHPVVVGQHLGDEPHDPALAARLGEVLEQELPDPAALLGVLHQEGDLGDLDRVALVVLVGRVALVAAERDHPPREQHHERHPGHVVDVGEPRDVAVGELGHRREEAVVLRLVGDPAVEVDQQVAVVGPDRPDVGRTAVTQQDVGLPVAGSDERVGIGGGHGRNLPGRGFVRRGHRRGKSASPLVGEVRVGERAGAPSVAQAVARWSTRSPCTTTCGSSRTISSVSEPRNPCPGPGRPGPGRWRARRPARPRRPGRHLARRDRTEPSGRRARWPAVPPPRRRRCRTCTAPRGGAAATRSASRWVTTKTRSPTIGRPPHPSAKSNRWRPITMTPAAVEVPVEVVDRLIGRRGRVVPDSGRARRRRPRTSRRSGPGGRRGGR